MPFKVSSLAINRVNVLTILEGDIRTLLAARQNARDGFEKNRDLVPGSEEAAEKIHYANDVAKILRENVLQGRPVEGAENRYRTHVQDKSDILLRYH